MNLKEFVQETLMEIADAVDITNSQLQAGGSRATVNPTKGPNSFNSPINIEFDLAVTVESSNTSNAKGEISIYKVFSAGGGGACESSQSEVSRIKFSVPLALSMGETPEHEFNENGIPMIRKSLLRRN